MNAGVPLAAIATTLALSPEAQFDINALYQSGLGRPVDPVTLDVDITYLADGGSLAAIQSVVATSAEAATDINTIYEAVLGQPSDTTATAFDQNLLAQGTSLMGVRTMLALSPVAQSGINALYQNELGRPVDPVALDSDITYLANGGSLAAIRSMLATSTEATVDIERIFQALTGFAGFDNLFYPSYLASGGTLVGIRAIVASSQQVQGSISNVYQEVLNRAPNTAELASATAFLVGGGTAGFEQPMPITYNVAVENIGFAGSPLTNTLLSSLVNSSEFIGDINAAYETATGNGANPVEVASAQSLALTGFTGVLAQIADPQSVNLRLDGYGTSSSYVGPITPQMIGGSPGSFAYSLQNNDALISPNPSIVDGFGLGDSPYRGFRDPYIMTQVTGFNPATDVIQVPASQVYPPNTASTITIGYFGPQATGTEISGVEVYQDGGTALVVTSNGAAINLIGVNISSLTPANFRIATS